MGTNIAVPLIAVEDIYILGNEEKKCKQEIKTWEEEMDKLLLEMVDIEIKSQNVDKEEDQQKLAEKCGAMISIQNTKANRFATLCQMKIGNLEKQLKLLKMQKNQSLIIADAYKDIQEKNNVVDSVQHDESLEPMDDIEVASLHTIFYLSGSDAGKNQKKVRKELKYMIFGPQDEAEEEENETDENPSELMKLEKAAFEKLKGKLKEKNQTPAQAFFNKLKLGFK